MRARRGREVAGVSGRASIAECYRTRAPAFRPMVYRHAVTEQDKERLSVIIPAKNEAATLPAILDRVRPYCGELVVVDGRSVDETREVAAGRGARVLVDDGRGKGAAMRLAAREASREILIFLDADGSHDPDDVPRVAAPVLSGEYDLVIGSRRRGGSDELHSSFFEFIRLMGSEIIGLAINYRFGKRLTDYQNGLRAIRRDVMNQLGTTQNTFTIEQEMSIKCIKRGFRVGEVPAHEYRRQAGHSHIVVWKVGWLYVWSVLKEMI
jgi:dolichol-phosphate mannosyltransferase